jgi:hypothetical protein
MAKIAPFGRYRAFTANGAPMAGGKLYTYIAGTSTPKVTYTSKTQVTPNANPVILDANGYADVWLDTGGYKFILKDSSDVLQWTVDDLDGGGAAGFASAVISKSSGFNLSSTEQNNVIVCTAAITIGLLPAATAGDGFAAVVVNASSGNVAIDPNGSELINGAATLVVQAGSSATVYCDGLAWYASGVPPTGGYRDDVFKIAGSGDYSKKVALEVDGLTTATTRTLIVQDVTGTLYVSGGTDIPIADGGTGASTALAAFDALKQPATTSYTGVAKLPTYAYATTNTQVSVAAATWTATGLAVTITPQTSSQAVKLDISQSIYGTPPSGGTQCMLSLRLKRDATVVATWTGLGTNVTANGTVNATDGINHLNGIVYIDSPATTSAVTYSMEMIPVAAITVYAQYNSAAPSSIFALAL